MYNYVERVVRVDSMMNKVCASKRALFRYRWRTRQLIGASRDEHQKDGGWGLAARAAGRASLECSHQSAPAPLNAHHNSPIYRQAF